MSPDPASFIEHLREKGYHPRSNKHSDALARAIVRDLRSQCSAISSHATAGTLCYSLNFDLRAGPAQWNVDLVLGSPARPTHEGEPSDAPGECPPARVRVAIEIKSVMTEHHKAVKNRKRDLEAHHEHVHNYDSEAIAGGVLVINASPRFRSPLRDEPTIHRDPAALVGHCLTELRSVSRRGGSTGYGLEAVCAIVVDHDNIDLNNSHAVTARFGVSPGDPLSYDHFLVAICDAYERRFGRGG